MASITVEQERLLEANRRANGYTTPANAMVGIGHPPATLAPASFGGIRLSTPTNFTLDIAPKKITFFDVLYPDVNVVGFNPEGLLPSVADSSIMIAYNGVYVVDINMVIEIDGTKDYRGELYLNGAATGLVTAIDSSKNAGEANVSTAAALHNLQVGDVLTLVGSATANGSKFDPISAGIYVTRIR